MARPRVELHPEAIVEARAAYEWYAERNPVAANAFIAELDHAIGQHTGRRRLACWAAPGDESNNPTNFRFSILDSSIETIFA